MEEDPKLPEKNQLENPETEKTLNQLSQDYVKYFKTQISSGNWLFLVITVVISVTFVYGLVSGVSSILTSVFPIKEMKNAPETAPSQNTTTSTATPKLTPTPTPTPSSKPNYFDSVSFPQNSCGDKLPDNRKEYPVNFYPVFIKYTEDNIAKIQSKFCRDSFQTVRKNNNQDAIQVASFLTSERANQFKDFLERSFDKADIGEPNIIAVTVKFPEDESSPKKTNNPKKTQQKRTNRAFKKPMRTDSALFKEFGIDCGQDTDTIVFEDLEMKCYCDQYSCRIATYLTVNNYSHNWYEFQLSSSFSLDGWASIDGLKYGLIAPGRSGKSFKFSKNGGRKFKVRRIRGSGYPKKKITVNCNDKPFMFWGVIIEPKCKPSGGTFIKAKGLQEIFSSRIKLSLDNSNGGFLMFSTGVISKSGTITSNNKTVNIIFSVVPQ
ncbi:MAG: hypothetical protein F6K40_26465 [Okeania sp. SIO3I5]|uniref:hypothetical protein n=1 Tax=Okeania sp. SIO3I5 TaxID=2607805 RepID=UPI0013B8AEEF|nr:hypothetical protein [Okeania sp. SIO3I5]NEQ39605.1 hypothetical protein [Okeania sp. SIO3I5]